MRISDWSSDVCSSDLLAGELARTLDQLLVEDVAPSRLRDLEMAEELSSHWRRSLDLFRIVLDRWPEELHRLGRIDLAERRTRLMARLAMRWCAAPPGGFVCAAGVTTASPSIARLLRCVARSEERRVGQGCVSKCRFRWSRALLKKNK